jgi:16S rRNA processing protein RimM
LGAHGLRGEVVVAALTDDPDRFNKLTEVYLEKDTVTEQEIASARRQGAQFLVTFKGVETRDAAEKLSGSFISIAADQVQDLPAGGYYHFELVGMKVYDEDKQYLGEIVEVLSMPANDVWQVAGEKDFLLPATANVVLKVDKEQRHVIIRLLDGLID